MSIRLMSQAWEVDLPDSEKLILLALADWSDDTGLCWPSIAQLARKSSKSERTVQAAIRNLERAGHLDRIETPGRGCRYTVHPRSRCTPADTAPVQPSHPRKDRTGATVAPTPAAAAPNTPITHQSSPEASPPPKTRARPADPFPKPDWADAGHWRDFLANRKKKNLPNTASAHVRFLRDIEQHTDAEWPPGRILQHAAERGWGGIYDPREQRHGQRPHHDRSADDGPRNPMVRAALNREARRAARGQEDLDGWGTPAGAVG